MSDQPPITTLEDVQAWLGTGHGDEVEGAYRAAESYVGKRVRWAAGPTDPDDPDTWPPAPDDLVQAVKFQTARYLARRSSPDGFVGMGEFGPARVPVTDRDVQNLMDPYRRVVMG